MKVMGLLGKLAACCAEAGSAAGDAGTIARAKTRSIDEELKS